MLLYIVPSRRFLQERCCCRGSRVEAVPPSLLWSFVGQWMTVVFCFFSGVRITDYTDLHGLHGLGSGDFEMVRLGNGILPFQGVSCMHFSCELFCCRGSRVGARDDGVFCFFGYGVKGNERYGRKRGSQMWAQYELRPSLLFCDSDVEGGRQLVWRAVPTAVGTDSPERSDGLARYERGRIALKIYKKNGGGLGILGCVA
jgi:hypothetical protein